MAELVSYLTDLERDYLRRLFAESAEKDGGQLNPTEHTIVLESPSVERSLLLRMLSQLDTELVATDGCYCLRFRIEVAPNPYGGPAVLRLAPPVVTDRQGVERGARVRPPRGEVGLRDPRGLLRQARVLNISPSGMALEAPAAPDTGAELADLQLKLPGRAPFTVTGRVVRVAAGERRQQLAMKFERMPPEAQAALKYYVFDNYDLPA